MSDKGLYCSFGVGRVDRNSLF